MTYHTLASVSRWLVWACLCGATLADAGDLQPMQLVTTVPVRIDYLLYLPSGYAEQDHWPLVLFLHGAGERGEEMDKVKVHGPPQQIAEGNSFPFVLVSPQCPRDGWWDPRRLILLLDSIIEEQKIDRTRVYCTGLSMGGSGTWALATRYPERFAAIAPICGSGQPGWVRSNFPKKQRTPPPVWAFHGGRDETVHPEETLRMVEAWREAGGKTTLTIHPQATHEVWKDVYSKPAIYAWLLSHRRGEQVNADD